MVKEIIKNVSFVYEDFCIDCPYHEFEITTESVSRGGELISSFTIIQCKKLNACKHVKKKIEKPS